MKITLRHLKLKGACSEQVALFQKHFGQGGEVTLEKCLSVADVFDWSWAARNLLSPAADTEYERAKASALAEYERAKAAAFFAASLERHS